ncbi:hypothetical protein WN55_00347 [Dufourea novaeangliae]|uniref:Uncharacterized protein n=1 Tax=Dufourea novaeangliae TaxID=178035 RepID=A0A154PFH8_DUFNO|nr:hypothetical protein WN55_00347 [Dufourea novaeangliae]
MRIFLFNMLVMGMLLYGAELYGYKKRKEVEKVQIRYLKRTLRINIRSPEYIVLEETKREKIGIRTGIRTWRFEEGVREGDGRKLVKECLKEKESVRIQTKSSEERQEYRNKNGIGIRGAQLRRERGVEIIEELRMRDFQVQQQVQYNKVQKSKFNQRYTYISTMQLPEYLKVEGKPTDQKLIPPVRCGSLEY